MVEIKLIKTTKDDCMPTKGEFITYPVGQGLFYAGKLIKDDKEEFNFIYDCGSNSKKESLTKCISEYKTFNGTKDIDMLVVSHFDSDHINGLKELTNKYNVKRVFFPYIKNMDINLVSYALKTLRLMRVIQLKTKVILMSIPKNDGAPKNNPKKMSMRKDGNPDDLKNKNLQLPSLDELELQASENATQLEFQVSKTSKHLKGDLDKLFKFLVFKNNQFRVFDWIFDFYNYPLPKDELRGINTSFRTFIHRNKIKNFYDFINCERVWKAFYKSVYTNNIKEYKFMNSNNISLCMMHAPKRVLTSTERIATLLTGDLNLKHDDIFADFNKKYSYIMSKLKAFFVPHHGSRNNWNDKLLYRYCKDTLSIITAGSGNVHPDFEVISKIILSKNDLVCITEKFDSYKYTLEQE